jgi:hypothetical protein
MGLETGRATHHNCYQQKAHFYDLIHAYTLRCDSIQGLMGVDSRQKQPDKQQLGFINTVTHSVLTVSLGSPRVARFAGGTVRNHIQGPAKPHELDNNRSRGTCSWKLEWFLVKMVTFGRLTRLGETKGTL